jgi:hypothetical protein
MSRRVLFGVVFVVSSIVPVAAPAAAHECIEVGQVKYCPPVATGQCIEVAQVKYCAPV